MATSLLALYIQLTSSLDIPWNYNGYDHLPVAYFGASENGLENITTMTTVSKFDIVGYGWQQNFTGHNESIYLSNQAYATSNFIKYNIN